MRVRLRLGREEISKTPYKRFGQTYIIHLLKDGAFQKSKCSRRIRAEDSIGSLVLEEKYGRHLTDGYGICELGLGNFRSFSPYRSFIFTFDDYEEQASLLKSSQTFSVFLIPLGEIKPFAKLQLNIEKPIERISSSYTLEDLGVYFFTQFASFEILNEFNISLNGNTSYYWHIEPLDGSLNLVAYSNSELCFSYSYFFTEQTDVLLNFNYDSYRGLDALGGIEIWSLDELRAQWKIPSGISSSEINLTARVYQDTIIKIRLKGISDSVILRLGKLVFINQNNQCIWI